MKKKNISNVVIIIIFITIILISSFTYIFKVERNNIIGEGFLKNLSVNIYSIFPKTIRDDSNVNIKNGINEELSNEVDSLKKVLELNHNLGGFTYVNATILSRNVSYWLNNLVIDKGSKDNIKKNNCVITPEGLIGKITKVNKNSSIVKLITSSTYKVSVNVGDKYGVLESYNSRKKLFKITGVDRDVKVSLGDKVTTSGLGGIFPSGIYIGSIKKIKNDNYDTSKTVYIEPIQDFNNIRYVTVLEKYDE